jgi:hypothetical protein
MSPDTDRLFETDPTDPPADAPKPAQPVVVIQYRSKSPPWLWIFGFSLLAMVIGIATYHRLVVERFRSQFVEDKRELESWLARQKERAERPAAVDTGPPVPLAMNTQPAPSSRGDSVPSGVTQPAPPAAGTPAAATSAPAPAAPGTQGVAAAAAPTAPQALDTKAQLTKAGLLDRPATDPAPTPPQPQPKSPFDAEPHPVADASPPPPLPASRALPAVIGPLALFGPSLPTPTRPDAPAPTPAPAEEGATAGPAPTSPPGPGPGAVADSLEPPPLPSKEESLRAIVEEAVEKQRELAAEWTERDAQILALRDEERRKFLDELSEILRVHDRQAGPEIEKLCVRTGRDDDPAKLARARRVLSSNRLNQREKIQRLRDIGLPETVILDYLANELHRRIGSRKGPRDRYEVLYLAAHQLLKQAPAPARPAGPAAAPATRPSRMATPRSVSTGAR